MQKDAISARRSCGDWSLENVELPFGDGFDSELGERGLAWQLAALELGSFFCPPGPGERGLACSMVSTKATLCHEGVFGI